MAHQNNQGNNRIREYTALRKPLDTYVRSLQAEIYDLKKQLLNPMQTIDRKTELKLDLLQHTNTNLKKQYRTVKDEHAATKQFYQKRELMLLKEIDRLKEERDDAEYRLELMMQRKDLTQELTPSISDAP